MDKFFEKIEQETNESDFTEWDKKIFSEIKLDWEFGEISLSILLQNIKNIIRNYSLFKFWLLLNDKFTKEEIDTIIKWVQSEIEIKFNDDNKPEYFSHINSEDIKKIPYFLVKPA